MANPADTQLLHVMASMLPLSSSLVRENRWESDVANVISVHLCKEDEDGNVVDDNDAVAELDPHDVCQEESEDIAPTRRKRRRASTIGSSLRSFYEDADELIGGPLYPTDADGNLLVAEATLRRRLHRKWKRRLDRLVPMRQGKRLPKPEDLPTDTRPDDNSQLATITENGHHAPVSVRVRILTAYRIDRINTMTRRCTVDVTTQRWVIDGRPIPE